MIKNGMGSTDISFASIHLKLPISQYGTKQRSLTTRFEIGQSRLLLLVFPLLLASISISKVGSYRIVAFLLHNWNLEGVGQRGKAQSVCDKERQRAS